MWEMVQSNVEVVIRACSASTGSPWGCRDATAAQHTVWFFLWFFFYMHWIGGGNQHAIASQRALTAETDGRKNVLMINHGRDIHQACHRTAWYACQDDRLLHSKLRSRKKRGEKEPSSPEFGTQQSTSTRRTWGIAPTNAGEIADVKPKSRIRLQALNQRLDRGAGHHAQHLDNRGREEGKEKEQEEEFNTCEKQGFRTNGDSST